MRYEIMFGIILCWWNQRALHRYLIDNAIWCRTSALRVTGRGYVGTKMLIFWSGDTSCNFPRPRLRGWLIIEVELRDVDPPLVRVVGDRPRGSLLIYTQYFPIGTHIHTWLAKRWVPGLVNFVPAVAYHFCLNLPAAFTQPRAHLLAESCTSCLII